MYGYMIINFMAIKNFNLILEFHETNLEMLVVDYHTRRGQPYHFYNTSQKRRFEIFIGNLPIFFFLEIKCFKGNETLIPILDFCQKHLKNDIRANNDKLYYLFCMI